MPVKLPADAVIAPEKLTRYLLVRQARGDKSAFLARAGYTAANPDRLLHDLRSQMLAQDAAPLEATPFGQLYEILAPLTGPNGTTLRMSFGSGWNAKYGLRTASKSHGTGALRNLKPTTSCA